MFSATCWRLWAGPGSRAGSRYISHPHHFSSGPSELLRALQACKRPLPASLIALRRYASATADLKFSKSHEWVRMDGSGAMATIGISNHAQEALGDIVFAELPAADRVLSAEGECGVVESVKAATDLYSPLSGTVTEKNADVEADPSLINKSCYENGWLFKLKLSEPSEVESLMNEAQYENFLKSTEAEDD